MKIIFIFIDGFGIGEKKDTNPLFLNKLFYLSHFNDEFQQNNIKKISSNIIVIPLDATLDIPGIPQSATGQASLFTGKNVSKIIGEHKFGFPNKEIRKILINSNILLDLKNTGFKTKFINVYPYFADELSSGILTLTENGEFQLKNKNELINRALRRISVTTVMALTTKQSFYNINDLKNRESIYQDFTNKLLIKKNIGVEEFTPEEAGKILLKNTEHYDFILYEYFLTDKAGHKQDSREAINILESLNRFITYIIENKSENTLIVITSDHGNIEDLSIKTHTYNKVPCIISDDFKNFVEPDNINSLTDVYDLIVKTLSNKSDL